MKPLKKNTKKDPLDASHMFNSFAGLEVDVTETPMTHEFRSGEKFDYVDTSYADDEPTIVALREFAKAKGLKLRVAFPDSMLTCDHVLNRATVRLEKSEDGKWRVSPKVRLG